MTASPARRRPLSERCPRCGLSRVYRNGNRHMCHPELAAHEAWDGKSTGLVFADTTAEFVAAQAVVQSWRTT